MLDYTIYLLYRAGTAVIALLPIALLFRIGNVLGFVAWLILPQYRALALHNVRIAFAEEKNERELRRLVRRHFQRLGANLLCSVKTTVMPVEKIAARVRVENPELMQQTLRGGRPVVLVLSHVGNWEVMAQLMPSIFPFIRASSVFQKIRNPHINADITRRRQRTGLELFDRGHGFGDVIELLRQGNAIGVLSDQHAGDHGIWTPFFGRLASTSPLAALLAKRTGAALFAAAVYTDGPARWRLVFASAFGDRADSVESLTGQMNRVLEAQIRAAPEDWFWVHNRWKTPRPNFLLSRYKRGVYLPPDFAPEKLKPFRILIRATNWLGDNVITVPAVRAIKRGRADAHITIAVREKIAAVWKLVPEVDEIIALPEKSVLKSARIIRSKQAFDVAIIFPKSLRTALESWLGRIPRRVGFRGHHRSWLLNQIVPERSNAGPIQHEVHDWLHLVGTLGADATLDDFPHHQSRTRDQNLLGLSPGAEYGPAKRWLPERFAQVAADVAATRNVKWILFGTKSDTALGEQIAAKLDGNCTNLIGLTILDELIARLSECRLLLTNDTGTMHLATLLGVPVVAVFGSTEPRLTGPLGANNRVIRHHVECSPCFLRDCPIDFRCMHAVSADEVTAAVLATLDETPRATDDAG